MNSIFSETIVQGEIVVGYTIFLWYRSSHNQKIQFLMGQLIKERLL